MKKRLEEMESSINSFFVETIHEMRTPLSLVLGSLSELLQRKNDIDSSEATQLLSAYRNTLALQDLSSNCEIPVMEMSGKPSSDSSL